MAEMEEESGQRIVVMAVDNSENSMWAFTCKYNYFIPLDQELTGFDWYDTKKNVRTMTCITVSSFKSIRNIEIFYNCENIVSSCSVMQLKYS